MLAWVILSALVISAVAQLQCHPETLTYHYDNEMKLWGSVEQSYHISSEVDIDCEGVSDLSTLGLPAFDFVVHMDDVAITAEKISSENVEKLCKNSQDANSTCTVGEAGATGDAEEFEVRDDEVFSLPVRFTQTQDGRIIRLQFMEEDFEHVDMMNMKKGIISTRQTRITGVEEHNVTDEETDVTGTHAAHYSTDVSAEGTRVRKEYSSTEETTVQSSAMKQIEYRVSTETLVQNGEIVDSKGEIRSQLLDDEVVTEDLDPEDLIMDLDVGEVLSSSSKFELKLKRKSKRAASRKKRLAKYKSLEFLTSSLSMNLPDETESKIQQLELLYGQLDQTSVESALQSFLISTDANELKLIKDIIMLETELGFQKIQMKLRRDSAPLVDILVTSSYGLMAHCETSWETCREVLELYTLGGRRSAESIFEFVLSKESTLTDNNQLNVINIASSMVNPSDEFVISLIHILREESPESNKFSSLLLGLGTLAGRQSVTETVKQIVSAIFLKELEDISPGNCPEDVRHADALEAIGNTGDIRFMERLMAINTDCGGSKIIRIALLHAMRGFGEDARVQSLMIDTLIHFDCEVSHDMLNLLREIIQEQQLQNTGDKWPLADFSPFDEELQTLLVGTAGLQCLRKDAIRYFKEKLSETAHEWAKRLELDGLDAFRNDTLNVRKRGVKQHSSCSWWSDHYGRYRYIQSASTFRSDTATYNIRKHCLGHFRIGVSKAAADIYAGFFAGYKTPTSSGRTKLFAKAVARGQIFSRSFSIGTVFLYFQTNGPGSSPTGRVYVMVAGRTFIDHSLPRIQRPSYQIKKSLFSRSISITLARIPLYITFLDIKLNLNARMELAIHLRPCHSLDLCLSFTPKAIARASASASVNLYLVEGGADIGVNLNYFVEGAGRVGPQHYPCIAFSHGADRNTVSLYFWYRLRQVKVKVSWWPFKIRIEWRWGPKKKWSPSSLTWAISQEKTKVIYSNCELIV